MYGTAAVEEEEGSPQDSNFFFSTECFPLMGPEYPIFTV